MIRVTLTYLDHTVDLRTDADYNPEVMETLIREAQDALTHQIITATLAEAAT